VERDEGKHARGDCVTFVGANQGDIRYQPDKVQFADGTV
jgi:hypothetical protein